jgi:hypothetical protein
MKRTLGSAAMLVALAVAAPGLAQEAPAGEPALSVPISDPSPASGPAVHIPAGTVVEVELAEAVSSRTNHPGDLFALRLRAPIVSHGQVVAPAGTLGGGEVIDAVASSFGGRQGRLILSARYLELGGQRVRIRGMQLAAAGEERVNAALAVGIAIGPLGMFVQGGEIDIPVGAHGTARLAADLDLPIGAAPAETITPSPIASDSAAAGQ